MNSSNKSLSYGQRTKDAPFDVQIKNGSIYNIYPNEAILLRDSNYDQSSKRVREEYTKYINRPQFGKSYNIDYEDIAVIYYKFELSGDDVVAFFYSTNGINWSAFTNNEFTDVFDDLGLQTCDIDSCVDLESTEAVFNAICDLIRETANTEQSKKAVILLIGFNETLGDAKGWQNLARSQGIK